MKISKILSEEFKVAPTFQEMFEFMVSIKANNMIYDYCVFKKCEFEVFGSTIKLDLLMNYNNFLKQSITLSMLVPCKDNGEPFEKPKDFVNGNLKGVTQGVNNLMYESTLKKEVLFSDMVYDQEEGFIRTEVVRNVVYVPEMNETVSHFIGYPITEQYFKFLDN